MPDYPFVVNFRPDTLAEPSRDSIPAYLLAACVSWVCITATSNSSGKTEAHFRDRARDVLQKVRTAADPTPEELEEALVMADDANAPDFG